jgi:hypothetical protein
MNRLKTLEINVIAKRIALQPGDWAEVWRTMKTDAGILCGKRCMSCLSASMPRGRTNHDDIALGHFVPSLVQIIANESPISPYTLHGRT